MILEFQTQEEAMACLSATNEMAAAYWIGQGYTVVEKNGVKQVISKNAATGKDEPEKQRTTTWDTVKESPDGTFYFTSLTGTPYEAGMEQLSSFNFTERPFPSGWDVVDV